MARSQARRQGTSTVFAIVLIAFAPTSPGCKEKSQPPIPVWKSGTTIIPGTFGWDAEAEVIAPPDNADLWWEMVTETECYLTPVGGARTTSSITSRSSGPSTNLPGTCSHPD